MGRSSRRPHESGTKHGSHAGASLRVYPLEALGKDCREGTPARKPRRCVVSATEIASDVLRAAATVVAI